MELFENAENQQLLWGATVVERLARTKLTGEAGKAAAAFKQVNAALATATKSAMKLRNERDAMLTKLGTADEALDLLVLKLADLLPAAGLGTRKQPFGSFSKLSPSSLIELAYAKQLDEVNKLLVKLNKAKLTPELKKLHAQLKKQVGLVAVALKALRKPTELFQKAQLQRDALLEPWQKSLTRLRVLAQAALIDSEGEYEALFAKPLELELKRKGQKAEAPAMKARAKLKPRVEKVLEPAPTPPAPSAYPATEALPLSARDEALDVTDVPEREEVALSDDLLVGDEQLIEASVESVTLAMDDEPLAAKVEPTPAEEAMAAHEGLTVEGEVVPADEATEKPGQFDVLA